MLAGPAQIPAAQEYLFALQLPPPFALPLSEQDSLARQSVDCAHAPEEQTLLYLVLKQSGANEPLA